MGLLTNIGDALSLGDSGSLSSTAINAANTAAEPTGWFTKALDYSSDAFSWLDKNPEAANIMGGVFAGVGGAYLQNQKAEDDRAFAERMYERRRRDQMINPGEIENYGTHIGTAKKGLLTNGAVAGGE